MSELHEHSATALAALIRAGDVTAQDVVKSHLSRLGRTNPDLNAVTRVLADRALDDARRADEAQRRGDPLGALHGVPFTVKENIDVAGTPTTQGVPAFADAVVDRDAPSVERLRSSGAVVIGRTNLSEMGLRIATENPLHGTTSNPWDPTRTAGGSSGGAAAAVAVGMSPIGIGNDMAGSLRLPALCCGVCALKPTRGRVAAARSLPPEDGGIALQLLPAEGPIARTVGDLQVALEVIAGRHVRDPRSVDAPLIGQRTPRRAAIVTGLSGMELPAAATAAVEAAANALHDEGWKIETVIPPSLERIEEIWGATLAADFVHLLPLLAGILSSPTTDMVATMCERFDRDERGRSSMHAERARLERLWSEFFEDHPVLLLPGLGDEVFTHGADVVPGTGVDLMLRCMRFMTPANLLGLPSVSLPVALSDGLPVGVQVYADRWREDVALEAGRVIERGTTPLVGLTDRSDVVPDRAIGVTA